MLKREIAAREVGQRKRISRVWNRRENKIVWGPHLFEFSPTSEETELKEYVSFSTLQVDDDFY